MVPVLLLGATLVGWAVMVSLALNDPSFAVEPDYYQKALAWEAHQAQERENERLGWQARAQAKAVPGWPGQRELTVELTDRTGRLSGASVSLAAFHNARASTIIESALTEKAEGAYSARLPMRLPGEWELRLTAIRGDERFTQVLRATVDAAPGRKP
jgi:nitrogen fixation protein FixH